MIAYYPFAYTDAERKFLAPWIWANLTPELRSARSGLLGFTCLVLGRECVDQEFVPPRSEGDVRELFQLRQQLDRFA